MTDYTRIEYTSPEDLSTLPHEDLDHDHVPDTIILEEVDHKIYSDSKFSILHLNIRSANKNFDQFLLFFQIHKIDCDVIALTEAWLDEKDGSTYTIPDYTTYYKHSTQNKCDGILLFIKNGKHFNPQIEIMEITGATGILVKLKVNNETTEIGAIYRSPSQREPQNFIDSIRDYFESRGNAQNATQILVGDFNIDLMPNSQERIKENYTTSMSAVGLTNVINKPTRVTETTKTCLDHIFINKTNNIVSYIIPTTITDHYVTMLKLKDTNPKHIPTLRKKTYTKTNIEQFKIKIAEQNWTHILECNTIETVTKEFIETIRLKINECTVTKNISSNRRFIKPWMTSAILNSIRKRDKMAKLLINEPFNTQLRERYKTYRNKLTEIIRKRKTDYFRDKFIENKHDAKSMWKVIKQATDENMPKHEDITLLDETQNPIIDKIQISNIFNQYFINVGPNLQATIEINSTRTHQKLNNQSIFLTRTTTAEVIKLMQELKTGSANGPDNIPARLIKEVASDIAPVLSHLINLCFEQSKFPSEFKNAITIPIYKNGDKTSPGNYRPISLISHISKIIEKAIKVRVMEFLEHTQFFSKKQFGFRKQKSTQDAVYHTCSEIYASLDRCEKVLALFLDLKKVFDTIPHLKLLEKLENAGIRGTALDLFKDYLFQRKQRVNVAGLCGNNGDVVCGIPQGTVLGPLLFLIYINDFCEMDLEGSLAGFADDVSIVVRGKDWNEVESKTNNILKQVKNWLDEHKLALNTEKTKLITFGLAKKSLPVSDLKIVMHKQICTNQTVDIATTRTSCNCPKIGSVNCMNYLGVIIDKNLKWDEHINQLTKKTRRTFYKFLRLRQIVDLKTMKMVYAAFTQSILQYCILIWGGARKKYINKLFLAQKSVLKIILKRNRRYPTEMVLSEADVLSINKLYVKQLIIHAYKQPRTTPNHEYNTRNIQTLQTPRVRAATAQRFCSYIAARFYNRVPNEIKQATDSKKFTKLSQPWLRSIPNSEIDTLLWGNIHR